MKLSLLTSAGLLSLLAGLAVADDPSAILSEFYSSPPSVTGSQLTALASALVSVESTWTNSPKFTSVLEAVYSAAPPAVQASLRTAATWPDAITAQPWFTGVPGSAQAALSAQVSAMNSVQNSVLGTPTSRNAAPRATGGGVGVAAAAAAAAAAVVGVVGAVVAL